MKYLDFLRSKMVIAPKSGINVGRDEISPVLKPHQRDAVLWALQGGRRAIFAAFGLGKTIMQLEWCRKIHDYNGGKVLIICPLGVRQEFAHDARELLSMNEPQYVRNMEEVKAASGWLLITNYERVRDGDIDSKYFAATSLDEAAVLRSFGSKTYQTFLQKFQGIKYKLVSTATPSPNKYKELIHYGGYLEIMDTGQALTRFFKRDSTKANKLTLYPHKEQEFWLWLSTWALFIQKPSDLGYDDTGYALPPMEIRYHELDKAAEITAEKDGQLKIFQDAAEGLKEAAREKRESIDQRVMAAKNKQMHICPLQFDIVDRLITRYSNPGDLVFDPFGGLMTVPVRALKLGRRGIATELNCDYFRDGVGYLKLEESKLNEPTLFDFAGIAQ